MNLFIFVLAILLPCATFCIDFNILNPQRSQLTIFGPRHNYTFNTNMIVSFETRGQWSLVSNEESLDLKYSSTQSYKNCTYCISAKNEHLQINDRTDNGCTCKSYNCSEDFIRIYPTYYFSNIIIMINENDKWHKLPNHYYAVHEYDYGLSFVTLKRYMFRDYKIVKMGVKALVENKKEKTFGVQFFECGYISQQNTNERFEIDYFECTKREKPICIY